MNFIMTVFGYPFGWLMYGLYHLVSNYGVALVLFTLIVKLLLFPLGLRQALCRSGACRAGGLLV